MPRWLAVDFLTLGLRGSVTPYTQTLIAGIVGVLATLVASGLGLYFTAKARTAPLRELLYTRQLDLSQEFLHLLGRVRVYAPLLLVSENQFKVRAREDLTGVVKRLSELTDQAAAILPVELYAEVLAVANLVVDFMSAYDHGSPRPDFPAHLAGRGAKAAAMVRTLLGVEELSEQSVSLFAKADALDRLAGISPEDILRIAGK